MNRFDINGQAGAKAYSWAILGYGNVAVGHTEGIIANKMRLAGFSTTKEKVRSGDATDLTFNIGPTKGRLLNVNGMICVQSAETLLSQAYGKADGVIVCAPTAFHLELGKKVADAGLPCFMEKPAAGTGADAEALMKYFEQKKQKLVIGHVLPAFPEFALLRRLLIFKGVNNVTALTMERYVPWSDTDDEEGNRLIGGAAKDLGIHDAQLLASVARPMNVKLESGEQRYDLYQRMEMRVTMENATVPFRVIVGASRQHEAFHHGYDVQFSDGTHVTFDGKQVNVVSGSDIEAPEPKSVGEVFGEELEIAASYFQGRRSDASYLEPKMAVHALKMLEHAVSTAR